MAGEERTVKVCGLPADIDKDKLTDKLLIHFLRRRNGGGEISSVFISKVNTGCAFITFEESEVAQSVVQHNSHVLLVDDRKYELSVSLSKKTVDELLPCVELTVYYSLLPRGKVTMTSLQRSSPELKFNFNLSEELCTVRGRYTEMQVMVTHLLSLLEDRISGSTCVPATGESRAASSHLSTKTSDSRREDQGRSSESETKVRHSGKTRDLNVGYSTKTKAEGAHSLALEGYAGLLPKAGAQVEDAPLEDYSLVLESDIFRYLQCHCSEEYNHILSKHKVEVVDVTTQDVTTLYLQATEGNVGSARERIEHVHWELGQLYQEKAFTLRKEQLPKAILSISHLSEAYEALRQQMPKLMITDDDIHVYLVGSRSDVSEAKQYLLDFRGTRETFMQTALSNVESRAWEAGDELFLPPASTSRTQYSRVDKLHKTTYQTTGMDCMLPAKFREGENETPRGDAVKLRSGNTASNGDWKHLPSPAIRPITSNGQISSSGPAFGTGSTIGGTHSLPGANETGQVIFSKRTNAQLSTSNELNSLRNMMPSSSLLPSKTKHFTSTQCALHTEASISAAAPPPTLAAQPVLRRSNSFSSFGRSKKDEKELSISSDIQGKTKTHSNNVSDSDKEEQVVYHVEVRVSAPMWIYVKDMYRTWLEEVFASIETKEVSFGNRVVVKLCGTDVEKLSACEKELKKQMSVISTDFNVQVLTLNDLGVKMQKEKPLEAYCAELRKKFQKVAIVLKANSVYILGPKLLCNEVYSSLIEAFGEETLTKTVLEEELLRLYTYSAISPPNQTQAFIPQKQADFMKHQESSPNSHSSPNRGEAQHTSDSLSGSTQVSEERQVEGENLPVSKGTDTLQRTDSSQGGTGTSSDEGSQSSTKKDPVLKVKLGMGGTKYGLSLRTGTAVAQTTLINQTPAFSDGSWSLPSFALNTQKVAWSKMLNVDNLNDHSTAKHDNQKALTAHGSHVQDSKLTVEENRSQGNTDLICVCGESGLSMRKTTCGVLLCVKCTEQGHSSCKVCHSADELRGIIGKMYFSEVSFSLPGHPRDMTLKITYKIPDGIQGEGNPKPGKPFKGGMFEAYLPNNEQSRRLCPLLKKAFTQGLTFTITGDNEVGKVVWGRIPHKTSIEMGLSRNGYPDATYLRRLADALKSLGITEGKETKSHEKKN